MRQQMQQQRRNSEQCDPSEEDQLLRKTMSHDDNETKEGDVEMKNNSETVKKQESSFLSRGFIVLLCLCVVSMGGIFYIQYIRPEQASNDSTIGSFSINELSEQIVLWIEEQGIYGPFYYVIFLSVWVILLLPCSIIEIIPGYLFGFTTGWIISILGKTLGSFISVLMGRYMFQESIKNKIIQKYPMLKAFNKAIKQEGFKMILMIRVAYRKPAFL